MKFADIDIVSESTPDHFIFTMAEEEGGRKFGWWWSPFRGAQVKKNQKFSKNIHGRKSLGDY